MLTTRWRSATPIYLAIGFIAFFAIIFDSPLSFVASAFVFGLVASLLG